MLLNILVKTMIRSRMNKKYLFEINIFCNIIKVFTVTFGQFKAFLQNLVTLHKKCLLPVLTPYRMQHLPSIGDHQNPVVSGVGNSQLLATGVHGYFPREREDRGG